MDPVGYYLAVTGIAKAQRVRPHCIGRPASPSRPAFRDGSNAWRADLWVTNIFSNTARIHVEPRNPRILASSVTGQLLESSDAYSRVGVLLFRKTRPSGEAGRGPRKTCVRPAAINRCHPGALSRARLLF